MKILALEAENIKHLRVVSIKPDGSLIVVGGDNSEGKTCVLDSIEYALNGACSVPSQPIRRGQKKARVVLDLGDIIVTRTFNTKGTNLTVKNRDGATFASPQAMLDKLIGRLTFDPLEFSRMDRAKQTAVLRELAGLNIDKMRADYKALFDKRAVVNKRGKELKAQLDGMTKHDGVPEDEVSISDIGSKYSKAIEHNKQVGCDRVALESNVRRLAELKRQVSEVEKIIKDKRNALDGVDIIDTESIRSQIDNIEETNRKIRENNTFVITNRQLNDLRIQSESLNEQMNKLTENQAKAIANAKFPVDGLGIDDNGVIFDGVPFDQCSTAQRIRVSVAMGIAMNPKLRVLLIREGSLLDKNNLEAIAKMAEESDVQVWMERVSKGKECQIIIEDGEVLQSEPLAMT